MKRSIYTLFLVTVATGTANADDWPQWLGPNRDSVWRESGIVETFPAGGPPLRWKQSLGGGYSGPAVSQGKVFVMDRIATDVDPTTVKDLHEGKPPKNVNFVRHLLPGKERVVCLKESDGSLLWTHEYDRPYTTVAIYAMGPRVTPTVVGELVYTLGAEGDLRCLRTSDGKPVWTRDLNAEYKLETTEWGYSSHPLVDGDRLICVVGGEGTAAVAFDRHTGRELWRSLSCQQPGYCPPVIYEIAGRRQLIIWHGEAISGLDPKTGVVYWSVPLKATFGMAIGTPRIEGNQLFIMSFNRQSTMIRVDRNANADSFVADVAWSGDTRRGIGGVFNTPFIHAGHIYACGQGGRYACAKLSSGDVVWQTFKPTTGRRPASWANAFTIKHHDRFFLANDLGELIIARLSPDGYEEISRTQLVEPTSQVGSRTVVWSHPAFANRSIYLRNDNEIRCYSLAK